jgi:hypothetical protein
LVVSTHGVLLYRLGRYEEALELLTRSDADDSQTQSGGSLRDLAFIAMAHYRLGHEEQAQATLARLREIMKAPEFYGMEEAQGFLAEAEALFRGDDPERAAPASAPTKP